MLVLLLDAFVLIGIIYLVNQGEQMNFGPAIISALLIAVGSFICALTLAPMIGLFVLIPVLAFAILVIWMVSGVPLEKAAIAGVIFTVYKVALSFGVAALTA
jgi:hypothetical protein